MNLPAPASDTAAGRLSIRDEAKPFILIGAIVAGFAINRLADGALTDYGWLVQVGLFAVVFSIMAFVEIKGVGRAFRNTKSTALAVTTNFVLVPLFAWTLGWLILHNHPDLWAGVILYTLTPCIGWYLIFIDLAKGNLEWGLAMLPIDITLQIVLLPLYLWLLIGKVIPIQPLVLIRSVAIFLLLPFAAAYAVRILLTRWRGRDFTYGPYKHAISEVKLWALVIVVTAIFATQHTLEGADISNVALIIATITLFFIGLFTIALTVGRVFKLDYPDTAAMVFEVSARNSESVIGIAAVAFAGHPLVIVAILIGPVVELPVLIALTKTMLHLRHRWTWPTTPATPDLSPAQG
ncbi:arsenic resistance protein [Rhabdothermincola sediminis]|uniref:arsenic resistance protein n=1 Tax=Rhabdothermincola sediminis TaxID=2751370 RepID=UPI001AA08123|nr:bile acid:sodium symporter [Rhabdothermincola sediminis]